VPVVVSTIKALVVAACGVLATGLGDVKPGTVDNQSVHLTRIAWNLFYLCH